MGDCTHSNVVCNGASTGSVSAGALSNTVGAVSYSWKNAANTVVGTTATVGSLPAGTYTLTVTDDCGTLTCSQTITQPANPLTASSIHGDVNCTSTTSGTVTATTTGGTSPYSYVIAGPTVNITGAISGAFTGLTAGSYTVTVTDANRCITTTTTLVGNLPCIVCSYTQGFWGNNNGLSLLNSSGILNTPLIIGGVGPNTIKITSADIVKLNNVMPGGKTPGPLANIGACNISTASCFDVKYLTGGRINNNLLSQTITLSLNARLGTTLNNIPIKSGCLFTSGGSYQIDNSVVTYLTCKGTATVSGLLSLANAVLGGALIPGATSGGCTVPSYSAINSAVDLFNNAFDECKSYIGYGSCVTALRIGSSQAPAEVSSKIVSTLKNQTPTRLKVNIFPNPYNEYITFNIESNISGKGILEIYNLLGQKLKTVFEGNISAGKGQIIRFNVPEQNRSNLIYRLRVADKSTTGKVLYIN